MRSDGGFVDFLKSRSGILKSAAVLAVGLFLLLFGRLVTSEMPPDTNEVSLENRLAEVCSSLDSAGECTVMITYGEGGEVEAVLVLCEGADKVEVRADIKELCKALFGIGSNRVSVLKIREEKR